MTEQTAPFGGLAVAEPQTALLPVDGTDEAGPDNRRKLAIVGAAVGVLVLLVAAFFLLKGGGGEVAPVAPHVALPVAGASDGGAKDGAAAAADKPVKMPKPYADPIGRDPFKAQYVAPVAAKTDGGTGTTASGATDSTGASDNVTVTTSVPGATTGTTTDPTTVTGADAAFAPVWIELVKVNGVNSATFVVGYSDGHKAQTKTFSKVAAPTDGLRTTFAGVFALLSIQDGTVTLQFGDGTPFDLNKGFGSRHFVG
jgi:hypothetical protein